MTATVARPVRARNLVAGNVVARLGALGALGVATVLVARAGGPVLVGGFTLLRVLPGLAGVLAAAGLPGAAPYFLARVNNPDRPAGDDPPDRLDRTGDVARAGRLRATLGALTLAGATLATVGWLVLTPVLHQVFFRTWSVGLVAAAGLAVFSQLQVAVGKALLQGTGDLRGANVAIVAEEAAFLPVYVVLLPFGRGAGTVLVALVAADVLVALGIAERLRRAGYFRGWRRPDAALGKEICGYGWRGQLGGLLSLVNLRLDVAILGALAGPGVLGVYAIASKYAELLRLPGLAINYVLYPAFSGIRAAAARARTRSLIGPAFAVNAIAAVPLAIAAGPLLPLVYGDAFRAAVHPTWILLAGLVGDGVTGLMGAYLYGVRRPGLNSLAIGAGVLVTVVGDVALIPLYGAMGAALASAVAYLVTTAALLGCFGWEGRRTR